MIETLMEELRPLIETREQLAHEAETLYSVKVGAIIRERCRDANSIDLLLDSMLSFCFDDQILTLYKKLCRYYFTIDPGATANHIYAYRDMWDDDYEPESEAGSAHCSSP